MRETQKLKTWVVGCKLLVALCCLVPLLYLVVQLASDGLGANPAETLIRSTGDWALRGLCVVLALAPLQRIWGGLREVSLGRLLGLFTFFYATLHALAYLWLDMAASWSAVWTDLQQRWFILGGACAWALLLVLALTSHRVCVQLLGWRRWRGLHQSVHAAAWLALLHFFWMRQGKNDGLEVAVYAAIIALLQMYRVVQWVLRRYSMEATAVIKR